jgi:putative oxidoreductase
MIPIIKNFHTKYISLYKTVVPYVQDLLLFLIRIFWGWGFFEAGKGKFMNFERTTNFFSSLNIPFPEINVFIAASTEMFGGLLLLIGLGSRIVPLPLIFTMIVAYLTAHTEELSYFFSDTGKFIAAEPFLFLLASLIVFLFGSGRISTDYIIRKLSKQNKLLA